MPKYQRGRHSKPSATHTCLCLCPCACAQVDVTAQGEAADTTAPKWTKTASDEALRAKQGNQAANLISNALQNMGWGASPWAKLQGHIMRTKPHKVRGWGEMCCSPGLPAVECSLQGKAAASKAAHSGFGLDVCGFDSHFVCT